MDNLSSNDLHMFQDKSQIFYSSIKISFNKIYHEEPLSDLHHFNKKNITILLDIFCLEGCLRLNPKYYIPDIISRSAVP